MKRSSSTKKMSQTYTEEELLAFEDAQHYLRRLRIILGDALLDEEEKSAPDQARLSEMRAELSRVTERLRDLKVEDREEIAFIHEQYRELFRRRTDVERK